MWKLVHIFFIFYVDIQTMAKDLEYLSILIPIGLLFIYLFIFNVIL